MTLKTDIHGRTYDDSEPVFIEVADSTLLFDRLRMGFIEKDGLLKLAESMDNYDVSAEIGTGSDEFRARHRLGSNINGSEPTDPVDPIDPPVPEPLSLSAHQFGPNLFVWRFEATGGTPDYTIQFGDGSNLETIGAGGSINHEYSQAGDYTATVTDADNNTATALVSIAPAEPAEEQAS